MKKTTKAKVDKLVNESRELIKKEKEVSEETKEKLEKLFKILEEELARATSKNSNLAPSQDITKSCQKSKKEGDKQVGGQIGHKGTTLEVTENPDEIILLSVDVSKIPEGKKTKSLEPEIRQVYEIEIKKKVIEYRAERLEDEDGNVYVAEFPEEVRARTQYGENVKVQAIILGQGNSIPYDRLAKYIAKQYGLNISQGTIVNFEKQIADRLIEKFKPEAQEILINSKVCGFDETGINISGKNHYAHEANNGQVVLFMPHVKRGKEAMEEFGVLPNFKGVAVHDGFASYYQYTNCEHALCNAHHLRELESIIELTNAKWAIELKDLLIKMNEEAKKHEVFIPLITIQELTKRFDELINEGLKANPDDKKPRSKSRCLLDRLIKKKDDVLRFLYNREIPFSNNDVERPIRMLKVEMKISGIYRSLHTAERSLIIRSYLLTCRNFGIEDSDAIRLVLRNQIPSFRNSINYS